MAVLPQEVFERDLRRLDRARLAAFVADLYAARGRETRVEDGDVVVETPTGTRRLRPVAGRRVDADGADAVVTTGRARLPADVDHVPPAALYRMALYALDRSTAEALLRRHLDRSVTDAGAGSTRSWPSRRAAWLVAAATLAILSALVAGAYAESGAWAGAPGDPPAAASTPPPAVTSSSAAVTPVGADRRAPDTAYPRGLSRDGVVDPEALAQAHGDAVAGRSYHLRVVSRRVDVAVDGDWAESWQAIGVENATNYRQTVSGMRGTGEDAEFVQFSAYADGRAEYRLVVDADGAAYRRRPVPRDGADEGVFTERAEEYVARFLDTNRTEVEVLTLEEGGDTVRVYRVIATGTPAHVPGALDYRAEATVRPSGVVSMLDAQFTVVEDRERRYARISIRYDDLDGYEVTAPNWLGDARNATAGTDDSPTPAPLD